MKRPPRYQASARFYDVISAERPVYHSGRIAAIDLLSPLPGQHILDIGCGTGLNFSELQRRIGPSGSITGVDSSNQMLDQARRRARSERWDNVHLVEADATQLSAADLGTQEKFDIVLTTYALSLMQRWPDALDSMILRTRPGGMVAVVDMQKPVGRAAIWTPLAKLACLLGGSDIEAHPWTRLESALTIVGSDSLRGGHIQVRVGSVPLS